MSVGIGDLPVDTSTDSQAVTALEDSHLQRERRLRAPTVLLSCIAIKSPTHYSEDDHSSITFTFVLPPSFQAPSRVPHCWEKPQASMYLRCSMNPLGLCQARAS